MWIPANKLLSRRPAKRRSPRNSRKRVSSSGDGIGILQSVISTQRRRERRGIFQDVMPVDKPTGYRITSTQGRQGVSLTPFLCVKDSIFRCFFLEFWLNLTPIGHACPYRLMEQNQNNPYDILLTQTTPPQTLPRIRGGAYKSLQEFIMYD